MKKANYEATSLFMKTGQKNHGAGRFPVYRKRQVAKSRKRIAALRKMAFLTRPSIIYENT